MIRINCVICNGNEFSENFKTKSTLMMVSDDRKMDENELFDLQFVACTHCGCVQLQKLYDPSVIYSQPLQCYNGPTLKTHYELFSTFILDHISDTNHILEIGGSYGRLAKIISETKEIGQDRIESYRIMEVVSEQYPPIPNIEYISGNCETFDYRSFPIDTMIMSHVFEHLYEPRTFLKKIRDANIQHIFLSNPDMENLAKTGDINNLNILHTYYIDTRYLTYLFNEYGYVLKNTSNYENNSVFYHFMLDSRPDVRSIVPYKNPELPDYTLNFYRNLQSSIHNIQISTPFFICPSGFYGKFVYNYLHENTRRFVLGFLDSDPMKIGKRLSGTPCQIYPKNTIQSHDDDVLRDGNEPDQLSDRKDVLIVSEKHKKELMDELYLINANITFHFLT